MVWEFIILSHSCWTVNVCNLPDLIFKLDEDLETWTLIILSFICYLIFEITISILFYHHIESMRDREALLEIKKKRDLVK